MQTKDHVLRDAMSLSPAERLEVAERLFESVEGEAGAEEAGAEEAGAEEAWAEEIARRIAAADSGEVKPVSWAEARKRIVGQVGMAHVELLPEAMEEARAARLWYSKRSVRAGERLK